MGVWLDIAMIWYNTLVVSLSLVAIASASTLPDFPHLYEKRNPAQLVPRASDPCCKSCGTIAKVLAECPTATTDIFCGCDQWVATAPACEACIFNVGFNTSFAMNPGPALELFWSWCQCQKPCRGPAEAIFGNACSGGTDKRAYRKRWSKMVLPAAAVLRSTMTGLHHSSMSSSSKLSNFLPLERLPILVLAFPSLCSLY